MPVFFWFAIISLFLTLVCTLEIALGMRRMIALDDVPPLKQENVPKVSVIIPACNEAATIEPALKSILAMDYADLEVIAVNDRSVDGTGAVLQKLQKQSPDLQIYDIYELPEGWLGKNHALQYGAERARGEYLLFTDADIIMETSSLARAMHHMLENGLDHLSMFFKSIAPGGLLNALILEAGGGLTLLLKPWRAKDPNSQRFMGVGAFNLVKSDVYKAIDGHRTIAMHPIDDVMLGKLIKHGGFSQDCLLGHNFIQVEWYVSVREFMNGLMKNTFAFYNYKITHVLFGVFVVAIINILPLVAFFFTSGITRGLFGIVIMVRILSFAIGFSKTGINPRYSVWALVSSFVYIFIVLKAAINTTLNQGIVWRGTYYPLDELKANLQKIKM
ncbi:MAG: glycosyltransferase [Deltaproteobacteria bacterium]|jgi:glycosyltransferase involved in cell wall biosynthesis|nr:glycosyltransferase [Deltaproteobacteria bacterium]